MRRRTLNAASVAAGGVSAVATSFAVFGTSQRFLVTSFNRAVLDVLPGRLVSRVIQLLGERALPASMVASGVALSVLLGCVAFAGTHLGRRYAPGDDDDALGEVAVAVVAVFAVCYLVVRSPVAVVAPALVGGAVTPAVARLPAASAGADDERRRVLRSLAAVLGYNVAAHSAGLVRRRSTQRAEHELAAQASRAAVESFVDRAADAELDTAGVKPLVSSIEEFYVVDINPSAPAVDRDDWTLSVTGEVEETAEFTFEDVRDAETVHQYKTIRCLSDGLDDDQLDTAVWTGSRVRDVLSGVEANGDYAMLTAADGYYYSMPLELLERCVLAYGMNGVELPRAHGYPVRLLVPGHWGKLHLKWLTDIEIIEESSGGYWEEQGWEGMGPVNAVTKIDRINRLEDGIRVVGHAYGGERGVQSVEVSVDGGDSWSGARLSDQLPDDDVARQWAFDVDPDAVDGDEIDFYARMVDGEGTVQPEARSDSFPDGVTGWVHRTLSVA
jgi:DMSO/TMAO reductase YedYZ molybdopterin-dependent catalytic subunit